MEFSDIETMSVRAGQYVFSKRKLALAACGLILCGLLTIFSMLFSFLPSMWGGMSPFLILFFVIASLLLMLGGFLIALYHDEITKKPLSYSGIFRHVSMQMYRSFSLTVPIIIGLLVLWLFEGLVLLLKEVPYLGDVVSVILSFVPFVWILGFICLSVATLFFLFCMAPVVALKTAMSVSRQNLALYFKEQLSSELFSRIVLFLVGLLPFLVVEKFIRMAARWAFLSSAAAILADGSLMEALFLLVPSVLLLTPTIIFFFNMAAEAHVFIAKSKNYNK